MNTHGQATGVLVVGAGIVGLSAALQLRLDGHQVTVVDPQAPMNGCSAGNAGCLSEANIFPPAMPDILSRLPKMLLSRDGPLVIRPSYLATMLPWLRSAARTLRPEVYERVISTMAALTVHAISSFDALLTASNAIDLISTQGLLVAFETSSALDDRARRLPFWRRFGLQVHRLGASETRALVPALCRDIAGGLLFPHSGQCLEPRELGLRYAQQLERQGARFIRAKVSSIKAHPTGTLEVHTTSGALRCDRAVVCAGYESKPLLESLGYRVPLAAERGYHLMLPHAAIAMRMPVIFGEPYFAATPMIGGIRLAGTAEFARFGTPPNHKRAAALLEQARRYLPDIDGTDARPWSGTRPSFADGMPAIGSLDRHPQVLYAFGHSHNGLTLSAITARCVSALVSGTEPPVSLRHLSLQRFQ